MQGNSNPFGTPFNQPSGRQQSPDVIAWLDSLAAQQGLNPCQDPPTNGPYLAPQYPVDYTQGYVQPGSQLVYHPGQPTPFPSTNYPSAQPEASTSRQNPNPDHALYQQPHDATQTGQHDSRSHSYTNVQGSAMTRSERRKPTIGLDEGQPLTVDGKPRERVYVACDRCRERRIRCDGARPMCYNCQRATEPGVECWYHPVPRRRGRDKEQRIRSPPGTGRKPRKSSSRKDMREEYEGFGVF